MASAIAILMPWLSCAYGMSSMAAATNTATPATSAIHHDPVHTHGLGRTPGPSKHGRLYADKGANPAQSRAKENAYIRPQISCPTEVTDLQPLLLRDLPSYANRVSTRAQLRERSSNPRGVVIAAAQAEVETPDAAYDPSIPSREAIANQQLIPLFFTTLERQYVGSTAVRLQHYHWAFLTQPQGKWELAMMFSRLGDYPAEQPVSPPRESRQGSIGRGLHLWLRDCNAGSIEALQPDSASPTVANPSDER